MNTSPFVTPTGRKIAAMLAILPPRGGVALLAYGRIVRYRDRSWAAAAAFADEPAERDEVIEAERRALLGELGQLHGMAAAGKGGVN